MVFCTHQLIGTGEVEICYNDVEIFLPWGSEINVQVKFKGELSLHWMAENFSVVTKGPAHSIMSNIVIENTCLTVS